MLRIHTALIFKYLEFLKIIKDRLIPLKSP